MEPSRILAVDHVNIEARPGLEDALRWFYGEVAVLDEVPWPIEDSAGLCFRSERIELRLHCVDNPRIVAVATRVTIAVPSLSLAAEQLDERRVSYERLSGLSVTDRCLQALDPAGNRAELRQESRLDL